MEKTRILIDGSLCCPGFYTVQPSYDHDYYGDFDIEDHLEVSESPDTWLVSIKDAHMHFPSRDLAVAFAEKFIPGGVYYNTPYDLSDLYAKEMEDSQ